MARKKNGLERRLEVEKEFHEREWSNTDAGTLYEFDRADFLQSRPPGIRRLLEKMDVAGKSVLDLGSGLGLYSMFFARSGAATVSLDLAMSSLNLVQASQSDCEVTIRPVNGAAERIPFRDASFDIVFAAATLHHLQLDYAISEIQRVLKSTGKLYTVEPLKYNPVAWLYRKFTPLRRTSTEAPFGIQDLSILDREFKIRDQEYIHLFRFLVANLLGRYEKSTFRGSVAEEVCDRIDRIVCCTPLGLLAQAVTIVADVPQKSVEANLSGQTVEQVGGN